MTDQSSANQNSAMPDAGDIAAALKLFDETTKALEARSQRLEQVLVVKQQELQAANAALEEKMAEVDRLNNYLSLVLRSIASGVIVVDPNMRITTCNTAARVALLGVHQHLEGAQYDTIFPDSPLVTCLQEGNSEGPYERKVPGRTQGQRILAGRAAPLRNEHGELLGAVEVLEDITEMRHLQDQLERGSRLRAVGEMAAGVAHEIRNPLNGIEGFASLLARDVTDQPRLKKYADAIVDGVRHLNNTVTGILSFTAPKPPEKRPVPIRELITDCQTLVTSDIRQSGAASRGSDEQLGEQWTGIPIELDDQWPGDCVPGDPTQLRQCILNILQNAAHILSEQDELKPHIRIILQSGTNEQGHEHLELCIDDNGPGIPDEYRQDIFTPFHTTRASGTGLGLAVVHTMVTLHGGTIYAESSPLGGARFRMCLPI